MAFSITLRTQVSEVVPSFTSVWLAAFSQTLRRTPLPCPKIAAVGENRTSDHARRCNIVPSRRLVAQQREDSRLSSKNVAGLKPLGMAQSVSKSGFEMV
ncbi:unnamed protein product [Somion occarium]|uniref:Uncharacterized protein n=1 Tax=Somion occarium TaxID=3059160 RepID=A0ABP1DZ03_9APHY